MPKKNPPDATRKEVAELRKRVVALERAVIALNSETAHLSRGVVRLMKAKK